MKNLFNFSPINRKTYWLGIVPFLFIYILTVVSVHVYGKDLLESGAFLTVFLVCWIWAIFLTMKRLKDCGWPWWSIFIPIINICALVFALFAKTKKKETTIFEHGVPRKLWVDPRK